MTEGADAPGSDSRISAARDRSDLSRRTGTLAEYAELHRAGLEARDPARRSLACWGMVAWRERSLSWVDAGLRSGDDDWIADAASVLSAIGVPPTWRARLRDQAEGMPDGESADALLEALGHVNTPARPFAPIEGILFGGRLLPFSEGIGYVEAPFDRVVGGWRPGSTTSHTSLAGPLDELLPHLEPVSTPYWKTLWVEADRGWTAQFIQDPSDTGGIAGVGREQKARSLFTHYLRHVVRDRKVQSYGNCRFSLTDWRDAPDGALMPPQPERTVQASYQSRWNFDLHGEPLPFEDLAGYQERRIPDRFNLEKLNRYCAELGIRRADPHFYGPRALLVEEDRSSWRGTPNTRSGEEWRAQHM